MTNLDLIPTEVDIAVIRGTDVRIRFQLTNGAGTPINISADTVCFTARDLLTGAVRIETKSNGPLEHYAPIVGQTEFFLTKEELADAAGSVGRNGVQASTRWRYEVLRRAGGVELPYIGGTFTLRPGARPSE